MRLLTTLPTLWCSLIQCRRNAKSSLRNDMFDSLQQRHRASSHFEARAAEALVLFCSAVLDAFRLILVPKIEWLLKYSENAMLTALVPFFVARALSVLST